jgi:NhaP-type Na+/H+ or K+/H+ antiporter
MFTSLMFKHIDFRKYPSLEFTLLLIACYTTYLLGEGLKLSGILAILSNGLVNSHYTHFNLSQSSQTAAHLMFKTLAYICETIVFAYLGLAVFTFRHEFDLMLIIFSVILIFLSRAANIFPLSFLLNKFVRTNPISQKSQFTMFFSGLRGAIAFSLSLTTSHNVNHNKIVTTTLFIVLFTTIILGGSTFPLLKYLYTDINVGEIGTEEDITGEDDIDVSTPGTPLGINILARMDELYVSPFFRVKPRLPIMDSVRHIQLQTYDEDSQISDDENSSIQNTSTAS